ncbi:MAG: DUF1211 domain-containing protein [Candidatus Rokuibacteriota bacterium]|jgi:uncharacterized membrane protein|nr:MAG: DUF1211 domain-containing protein [Candidatus Rokubacteria bacterium]
MRGARPLDPSPGGWFTALLDAWPKGRLGAQERLRKYRIATRWRIASTRGGPRPSATAIAITLLVLELSVPQESLDDLFREILDQWPSYLAYGTSFWTIAGVWLVHHAIFRRLRYADPTLMLLNLVLLMAVSFLPYPTKLMAEAIQSAGAERVAVLFYGATLLVISVIVTSLGHYAAGRGALLAEGVSASDFQARIARLRPSLAFYGPLLVAEIFVPQLAAFGLLAVSLLATALPFHLRRRAAAN